MSESCIKHAHSSDKRMVQMTVTGMNPQGKSVILLEPVTDLAVQEAASSNNVFLSLND